MPQEMRPEDLLAVLLETSEAAVIGCTLEGRVVCWSGGAEQLYGYSASEMAGERLARLAPIYEIAGWESLLEQARRGESPSEGQTERLHKDGTPVRIATRYQLLRGPQGEATGLLEIGKRLEWRGSEAPAETQLRALMQQVPGIVWTCDENLRITSNWGAGIPGMKIRAGDLAGR